MKKKIFILIVFLLSGALSLSAKTYSVVNNFPEGEYFYIKPAGSHLCLGMKNERSYGDLVLTSCSSRSAKWKFKRVRNGQYNLKNIRGGYMGIKDIAKRGSRATHIPSSGRDVKFLVKDGKTFFIRMRYKGRVLDVAGGKKRTVGAKVIQWDFHGGGNQQWRAYNVSERKYFDYYAQRRESRYSRPSGPTGAQNSLSSIIQNDYQIARYFQTCTYSQLSNDTRDNYLVDALNGLKLSKRLIKVQKIIDGVKNNRVSGVRSRTYSDLSLVNLSGGGFVEKMVKNKISGDLRKALRKETSYSIRKNINKLISNLK